MIANYIKSIKKYRISKFSTIDKLHRFEKSFRVYLKNKDMKTVRGVGKKK